MWRLRLHGRRVIPWRTGLRRALFSRRRIFRRRLVARQPAREVRRLSERYKLIGTFEADRRVGG